MPGDGTVKLQICYDPVLAAERVLYVRVFRRELCAWIDGSMTRGYRPHMVRFQRPATVPELWHPPYVRLSPGDYQWTGPGAEL